MRADPAVIALTTANDPSTGSGRAALYPMGNGLSRVGARFHGRDDLLQAAIGATGERLDAARAAELGLVTMALDEFSPADPNRLLVGTFVAQYPGVRYEGSAGALVDRNQWALTLIPATTRPCSTLPTQSGTTVLNVSVAEGQMTGEAVLVECEGSTTWSAEFTRR